MNASSPVLDIAIVGSGPSGFFCAEYLLRPALPCRVHMFERWPAPYGLVRGAVAPDHMHIRRVNRTFERIAAKDGFLFYGNVNIGHDIRIAELKQHFHAVLVTTGAQLSRPLDTPGAALPGCYGAADLAGWYNGRPDCAAMRPDLSGHAAVIVGAGNVALDMARMLAWPPEILAPTDISSAALAQLSGNTIRDLHIVARRDPLETRFTPHELVLLKKIPGCAVIIHSDTDLSNTLPASEEETLLLDAYARLAAQSEGAAEARRRIHLHFNLRPEAVLGDTRVSGMLFRGRREALVHIPCEMVIAAIGQRGEAIDGLPFNLETGTIPHMDGRVLRDGRPMPGFYVAGWIKRGAVGVIGTNKPDCRRTVQSILDDRETLASSGTARADAIGALLKTRGVRSVSFKEWLIIDAAEKRRGEAAGKAREPYVSVKNMLSILDDGNERRQG